MTVKVPEPWKSLGKGQFTDDAMAPLYDIAAPTREVEIFENANYPGCVFLKDAYGLKYWVDVFGIKESNLAGFPETYLKVDVSDPNKVVIEKQSLVLNLGYGLNYIFTKYDGMDTFGTFKDGVITFPVKSVYIEDGDGEYAMNRDGLYRIVMPGVSLADYSLELAYGGFRVAGDDETTYPIARVAFGVVVAQIQYAFVEGDITLDDAAIEATLAGMADGTIESTTVDAVDDTGEEMPEEDSEEEEVEQVYAMDLVSPDALGSGIYTVIALPINAEGEVISKDGDILSFYNPGVGEAAVPEVDLAAYAMTLEEMEKYDDSLTGMAAYYGSMGYNSTNCYGLLFEGSEISELKVLPVTTASIGDIIAKGWNLDEYVLAYDAQAQDIDLDTEYVNTDGWDYTIFGAKAGTGYTCLIYAKNAYGKEAMFYASHTTDKAEATAKRKLVLHKLDGVELNRNFNNVEIR